MADNIITLDISSINFNKPKFKMVGRTLHCKPLSYYLPYLPALVILANYSEGQSIFKELEDLRNDEPDLIEELLWLVRLMGGRHGEMPDGMVLDGTKQRDGFDLEESLSPALNLMAYYASRRCSGSSKINDYIVKFRWPNYRSFLQQ